MAGPPSADKLLERADKNKDGKLTKDELPDFAWTRLSTADTDKDGAVSKDELETHIKNRPAHSGPGAGGLHTGGAGFGGPGFENRGFGGLGSRGPAFGGRGFGRGVGRPMGGPPSADKLFEQADKNKDGSISKAELEEHFKDLHSRARPAPDKPAEAAPDKPAEKPADKPVEKKAE